MDVARLNFSHGSHEQHAETAQLVRDAAGRAGRPVALLQDLPGPKLRIGPLVEGTVELKVGDKVKAEVSSLDTIDRRLFLTMKNIGVEKPAAAERPQKQKQKNVATDVTLTVIDVTGVEVVSYVFTDPRVAHYELGAAVGGNERATETIVFAPSHVTITTAISKRATSF